MGSEIVFACYRPHAGKEAELKALISKHVPTLRQYEMLTDRDALLAQAKDGTFIEVFEWRSAAESNRAHEHPAVGKIWDAMAKVCDFVSLQGLEEAKRPFSHFKPVSL